MKVYEFSVFYEYYCGYEYDMARWSREASRGSRQTQNNKIGDI